MSPYLRIPLLAVACSAFMAAPALASTRTESAVRQTAATFIRDEYAGSPHACSLLDGRSTGDVLAAARKLWVNEHLAELGPIAYRETVGAVPDCQTALTVLS